MVASIALQEKISLLPLSKVLLGLALALGLLLVLVLLFHTRLLTAAGNFLIEDDGPHEADAALMLGGDRFCTRILKAAELAKAGYVPIVIVSGPELYGAHESDFTIPCATRAGYPSSLFHPFPSAVRSTRSETALAGSYLRSQGIHTVLLVTSNYHTRRAARLLRSQNPGLTVYAEAAPDPFFTAGTWWKSRSGQKTFLLEWTKTVAALLGV